MHVPDIITNMHFSFTRRERGASWNFSVQPTNAVSTELLSTICKYGINAFLTIEEYKNDGR
ncbi:hypothetical protein J2Y45_001510 [Dyadobacter sp. BE34]|uniref:Uncharacterized protein n=1 Tax=Dyadobacter fermentans TaxID=94254 RepID=A0ABU1QSV6_9BACT|nr:hypothetical protein [Dyadobacter fermentans]MDR7041981.1 hypothetical protein [Dyadobacter sp. BE242]MDR7196384.1 hypothetical protein [Dyadobacter sp. BE34]MDR7213071.1 hypothetical protein [Dyadobacter sp. BE31]MDR7261790.1 hypothetical protein [Dyadobacter sp. BE32]